MRGKKEKEGFNKKERRSRIKKGGGEKDKRRGREKGREDREGRIRIIFNSTFFFPKDNHP